MAETDTDETDVPSLLGRVLFGSGLAILAARNLQNLDGRIAYAEAKGVPLADKLVPAATGLLLGGGLGIGAWKFPKLSASSVAAFLVGVTPVMHDFWAVDDEQRGEELTSFPRTSRCSARRWRSSSARTAPEDPQSRRREVFLAGFFRSP